MLNPDLHKVESKKGEKKHGLALRISRITVMN